MPWTVALRPSSGSTWRSSVDRLKDDWRHWRVSDSVMHGFVVLEIVGNRLNARSAFQKLSTN